LETPDPGAWTSYGTDIIGARATTDDGSVVLKIDERAWRIAVHPGDRTQLAYLGFEVQGPAELGRAERALESAGVVVKRISGSEAEQRSVEELLRFEDPAGNMLELFYGQFCDYTFHSPRGVSGFVTGSQGLGHAVIGVTDFETSLAFYTNILGFLVSDYMYQGDSATAFLRCGPREHTIALYEVTKDLDSRLQHFMLEVGELDDVGITYDLVQDSEIGVTLTLGRHTNDAMVSFYCRTPSPGIQMEYGWAGKQMTPRDASVRMTKVDVWGHRIAKTGQSINDMIRK
jgi:2,3-dihydroxybiphenyl 1,2-dioxygenase